MPARNAGSGRGPGSSSDPCFACGMVHFEWTGKFRDAVCVVYVIAQGLGNVGPIEED